MVQSPRSSMDGAFPLTPGWQQAVGGRPSWKLPSQSLCQGRQDRPPEA